jgi:hypothetical protein
VIFDKSSNPIYNRLGIIVLSGTDREPAGFIGTEH